MTTKENILSTIIGIVIAVPITAAIYMWYNHVWVQWPLRYWSQLIPIAFVLTGIFMLQKGSPAYKILNTIFALLFAVTAVIQVANWVGIIRIPIL